MSGSEQQEQSRPPVRMTLFVADGELNSLCAKENLMRLCKEQLESHYELEVVDVLENFQAAVDHNIMVTPTLIVTDPPPGIRLLGDLRNTDRLRTALGLA
ncbi:MAG: circadian clock KaiB family protein [Planctomycetota bacterium]